MNEAVGRGTDAPFSKVAVANRGEIAIRVMRACEELGIATAALYAEDDRNAAHVRRADEAYLLGTHPGVYLDIDRVVEVAQRAGAAAIHPGYGFLAENAEFARRVAEAGMVFIGPPADAIDAMGSKTRARALMKNAGVPIVPGFVEPATDLEVAYGQAREIGYPVAVKAVSGGGGKAFRVAHEESELPDAYAGASREGERFFGDGAVYLERYLPHPRHVEVQVLADGHGNVVHLGERDCTIQRRHQKLIEEAPAPAAIVGEARRREIGAIAVAAARAVGYVGAGTVEGILSGEDYFFLEMNTRVQVEHCVTEMVTGIDIVREGILAAAGRPLSFRQDEIVLRGHAIECRINAEDAGRNFAPAPGRVTRYVEPGGPGVRVDSSVEAGDRVSPDYDSLLAKLVVWDVDRDRATRRMLRALREFRIDGVTTLLDFHRGVLGSDAWRDASDCTELLADAEWLRAHAGQTQDGSAAEPSSPGHELVVEVDGRRHAVVVHGWPLLAPAPAAGDGEIGPFGLRGDGAPSGPSTRLAPDRRRSAGARSSESDREVRSPLQGNVWKVMAEEGQELSSGQVICIVEAMKMENEIAAPRSGRLIRLAATEGQALAAGDLIAEIGD